MSEGSGRAMSSLRADKNITFRTELIKLAVLVGLAAFAAAVTLSAPPTTDWRVFMSAIAVIVGISMLVGAAVLIIATVFAIRKLDQP